MPRRGSHRTPDFGNPYAGGMVEEWGYGEYNQSNPPGPNVWELPTPTRVQSHLQEPDYGYGRDALDYWSDPSSHLDQASYSPAAQASRTPVAQAPYTPNIPAPYYPRSQGSHHPFGRAPYTSNVPAPHYPRGQGSHHPFGRAPYTSNVPAPHYPRGQGSHHPFGQAGIIPSVAEFAFSIMEGDHTKTTIICAICQKEIAKPYKGSYEPWDEDYHAGLDGAGYSYTTFHDSKTEEEVVRVYSDGLGRPCSWHRGRTVFQINDQPSGNGGSSHKHSSKSPGKSGHGGKGSSRR